MNKFGWGRPVVGPWWVKIEKKKKALIAICTVSTGSIEKKKKTVITICAVPGSLSCCVVVWNGWCSPVMVQI